MRKHILKTTPVYAPELELLPEAQSSPSSPPLFIVPTPCLNLLTYYSGCPSPQSLLFPLPVSSPLTPNLAFLFIIRPPVPPPHFYCPGILVPSLILPHPPPFLCPLPVILTQITSTCHLLSPLSQRHACEHLIDGSASVPDHHNPGLV